MALNRKRMRDIEAAANSVGLEVVSIEHSRGDHIKVLLRKGDKVRASFVPLSPGDIRGLLNWRSDVKRSFA